MALATKFFHNYNDLATWVTAHSGYTINGFTYALGTGFVLIYTSA
jgi:hypothetical protein